MKLFAQLGLVALILASASCRAQQTALEDSKLNPARAGYQSLLALFPEDAQGRGLDTFLGSNEDQPMTYGLVLSAEAVHLKCKPNDESRRRVRKATQWLLDNSDLHRDGKPGWGLPQPWDAFADGTTNSPNQPYTITTAIVLNGLLDALSIQSLWTEPERSTIRELAQKTVLRWCHDLWSEGYGGGYFRYSPCDCDNIFAVNSPAMFLGSMSRLLNEQNDGLVEEDRKLIESRADDLARAVAGTVKMRQGAPYWDYTPIPNKLNNRQVPNDLVHQVYILWGAEVYREARGKVRIPWTRAQALESLDHYWLAATVCNFPQDVSYTDKKYSDKKTLLWGTGAALAFYARWGNERQAARAWDALLRAHGPLPRLRLYPAELSKDDRFYPRHAAHALWGMSYFCFKPGN